MATAVDISAVSRKWVVFQCCIARGLHFFDGSIEIGPFAEAPPPQWRILLRACLLSGSNLFPSRRWYRQTGNVRRIGTTQKFGV